MGSQVSLKPRLDIQGLRAIAVLFVLIHHIDKDLLPGGYVGVDVFFVISGYLITGLLFREFEKEKSINLATFYLRRLRRLLPSLLFLILLTSLFANWFVTAIDNQTLLASAPYAAMWLSNLFFLYRQQDYFNEILDKDLFLHTWSLGVEEQFYLIWPVLSCSLLFRGNVNNHIRVGIIVLFLSLCLSVILSYTYPLSAFYQMPSRIWQFSMGAVVFLYAHAMNQQTTRGNTNFALFLYFTGLVIIFSTAFLFSEHMVYPGYWAIFPSIGTVLMILSGEPILRNNFRKRLLEHPALVWIGDRSYSIYLWHWPVIVLITFSDMQPAFEVVRFFLIISLTLLFAMINYSYIELPFWKKSYRHIKAKTFLLGSAATFVLISAVVFHAQRAPHDYSQYKSQVATAIRTDVPVIYHMSCDSWYYNSEITPCVFGLRDSKKTAILIADSIGAQWFSAWHDIFIPLGWQFIVLTKSSCPIVDEDYFYPRIGKVYQVCRDWRDAVIEEIHGYNPDLIIIGNSATYDFSEEQWLRGSERIFSKLNKYAENIVVISGTPILGVDGPACIARNIDADINTIQKNCVGTVAFDKFDKVFDYLSEAGDKFHNVNVMNPADIVCPNRECYAISSDSVPVFRDTQHITDRFARLSSINFKKYLLDLKILAP